MNLCVQLQDAYAEVFRVLKPGSYFASYEWVSTEKYNPNDRDHVRIIDEINYGNGLPVQFQLMLSIMLILLVCSRLAVTNLEMIMSHSYCRRCARTKRQRRLAKTVALSWC